MINTQWRTGYSGIWAMPGGPVPLGAKWAGFVVKMGRSDNEQNRAPYNMPGPIQGASSLAPSQYPSMELETFLRNSIYPIQWSSFPHI